MRKMIASEIANKLAVKDEVLEVDGKVSVESPEQVGHYIDTLHKVQCVIDEAIGTNDPVVLVEGATKFIRVGEWIDVSTNPDAQVPPIENGQVIYSQGDKMLFKQNGTTYYSETNGILVCDGTITEHWGKVWQGMGYIIEGGKVFQPLISQPKEAQLINVGNTDYIFLDDVTSSQAYYITKDFTANTFLSIYSLDGPIMVVLGQMIKGYNDTNHIDTSSLGIWSKSYLPTDNGYCDIAFGAEASNVYILVSNRIVYVDNAYEV